MFLLQRRCWVLATAIAGFNIAAVAQKPWTADKDLVSNMSAKRPGVIYDETNVPSYALPNPLQLADGTTITKADQWPNRREELLELFRSNVYGHRPAVEPEVRLQTVRHTPLFDGRVVGSEMKVTIAHAGATFEFPFAIYRSPGFSNGKRLPAIIHINNRSFVSPENAESSDLQFFPIKKLTGRGFVLATFHTSDVDPDQKEGYADGIRFFLAGGQPPKTTDWRALSAWGWAASRILDHLETDSSVDANRVAVVGHSRGGKAALWAAAEDERFAVVYSNQSGCGGAALSRRRFGERVQRITETFPHWFNETFSSYAEKENELPVDQHELMALIAPRRVFVNSAAADLWADPRGEYLSVVESAPVFQLLGQQAISEPSMPPMDQPRLVGATGYQVRSGKHSLTLSDWNTFLDFATPTLRPPSSFDNHK